MDGKMTIQYDLSDRAEYGVYSQSINYFEESKCWSIL